MSLSGDPGRSIEWLFFGTYGLGGEGGKTNEGIGGGAMLRAEFIRGFDC